MKTILITGCSSGFGLETARYFLERGWKVIATMRTPREDALPRSEHLRVVALDVTDEESIRKTVEAAGPIDALVNNAGVGLMSVFEGTSMETVRATFETNTFGTMAVTQAFLPQFRQRRAGVIVNVSSATTLKALPMLAAYTASKAALNAFTESLAHELQPFGVRVSLVIPGRSPETPFAGNAQAWMRTRGVDVPDAYSDFTRGVFERIRGQQSEPFTRPLDVAEVIWRAVNDPSLPIRQPAGADAVEWAKGTKSNVDRMRYFVEQVQQGGRFELIDSLVHAEYRNHTVEPGQADDRDGVRATMVAMHAAFSDLTVRILHCVGDADFVATHKVFRARHTGTWFGVPPSGNQVEFRVMDLVRYRDGQMVEHWAIADALTLLRQTGAIT